MVNLPAWILTILVIGVLEPINGDTQDLTPKQEIEKIRELARMIRHTENPSELTVQNLLSWLQGKYDSKANGNRRTRQQQPSREYIPSRYDEPSREYLPSKTYETDSDRQSAQNERNKVGLEQPRPFTVSTSRDRSQTSYNLISDQPNFGPYPTRTTPKPTFTEPEVDYGSDKGSDQSAHGNSVVSTTESDQNVIGNEESHPPHIHDINVQCAKDMMTITMEFNRVFNGVIYSKGFYNYDKCRYVSENSGQTQYTFTVSLDSCGTQFVDEFAQGGQAYLENTLVIQNEPGILEVWDTVRMVRCLWDRSIRRDLTASLVIGMLTQEVVTFNGDTGTARLDIQVGRGPFAPPANGLIKIGEIMTLVVYVEGDPGFDVIVRQCRARDEAGVNSIQLFDERGCVLKPKLFGSFQKTRDTGNTGASVIAYAFFNAFKFPDEMDLVIECNVELCKTDCEMCPDQPRYEPGKRRRRDVGFNETLGDFGNRVSGRFRVISEDDLTDLAIREHYIRVPSGKADGICMSTQGFLLSSLLILVLLLTSSLTTAVLWLKLQKTSCSKA